MKKKVTHQESVTLPSDPAEAKRVIDGYINRGFTVASMGVGVALVTKVEEQEVLETTSGGRKRLLD